MFSATHAYFSSKIYKSKESLLLVGSSLPDVAITKIIPWNEGLHGKNNAKRFFKFIEKTNPKYLSLGKGIYSHCILDDFTHLNYQGRSGYAYQNNKKLAAAVGNYYGEDKIKAEGKAHNYIESGVDILLLSEYPGIKIDMEKAIKKVDVKELSSLLGSYFKIDVDKFEQAISEYFDLITKYDLRKKDNWVFLWKDLNRIMDLKNIEDAKIKKLLDKSINIVKNTYKDFLRYSLREGLKEV